MSFDILKRDIDIHRNYLLEASAGTGKTFSIENIVVRLLLEKSSEKQPFLLEQILVVTFTKAAAKDLRQRIRLALSKSLNACQSALQGAAFDKSIPDYLLSYIEKGSAFLQQARRSLEQALYCFDQAQIYTIHGFCGRMLADNPLSSLACQSSSDLQDSALNSSVVLPIIRDYFFCELSLEDFSSNQLKIVLKEYENDFNQLELNLCKQVLSSAQIVITTPTFDEGYAIFVEAMEKIFREVAPTSAGIIEDFVLQAPYFRKICDKKKQIKPEILAKVEKFASLFEKKKLKKEDLNELLLEGNFFSEALSPLERKACDLPNLNLRHPEFLKAYNQYLAPLITALSNAELIFARLASACQDLLLRQLELQQKFSPDMLLKKMLKELESGDLAFQIRKKYQAVIIDEFQDTDPLQWQIFNKLFLLDKKWQGNIYLVGDPKQAIYAFRHADIYTYLSAAEALGKEAHATLDVNWRSHSTLIQGLNALFLSAKEFIFLPRLKKHLPYREVSSSPNRVPKTFSDTLGALHFLVFQEEKALQDSDIEEHYLFPFIAQEIVRLHKNDTVSLSSFAVLVSDRFQAERFALFCKKKNIPTAALRGTALADSPIITAFSTVLQSIISPNDESLWRRALCSLLIGWTNKDLSVLDSEPLRLKLRLQWQQLRSLLYEKGIGPFMQKLLQNIWLEERGPRASQNLLNLENGKKLLSDYFHLYELCLHWENERFLAPEKMVKQLEEFIEKEKLKEDFIAQRINPTSQAVKIVTIHSSKGLEFEIVFTLGLTKRVKAPSLLIPHLDSDQIKLITVESTECDLYKKNCEEIDAEKMRQLYVAMTRAKERLYLPVIVAKEKELSFAEASPMELFIAHLLEPNSCSQKELYATICAKGAEDIYSFLASLEANISLTYTNLNTYNFQKSDQELKIAAKNFDGDLLRAQPLTKPIASHYIHSFTSLLNSGVNIDQKNFIESFDLSYFEEEITHIDPLLIPKHFEPEIKSAHTLPAGINTGVLLHKLLEQIPLCLVKSSSTYHDLSKWVQQQLSTTIFSGWEEVFADLLFKAFHTALPGKNGLFSLAEIDENALSREINFSFANDNFLNEAFLSEDMVQGVIDLFFYHKGFYYMIDWKTNWLGQDEQCYSQKGLVKAMESHNYSLQAALYTEALRRYLAIIEPKKSFKECFGGTFYLFLRGLKTDRNLEFSGIYFL